jgi:hypothetical protein
MRPHGVRRYLDQVPAVQGLTMHDIPGGSRNCEFKSQHVGWDMINPEPLSLSPSGGSFRQQPGVASTVSSGGRPFPLPNVSVVEQLTGERWYCPSKGGPCTSRARGNGRPPAAGFQRVPSPPYTNFLKRAIHVGWDMILESQAS